MRLSVVPLRAAVAPGEPVVITASVVNTGTVISSHQLVVLGVDPRWIQVDRRDLALFPGEQVTVQISITLPTGVPAGTRRVTVQARESTPPGETVSADVEIEVAARVGTRLELNPTSVTGGTRGEVTLTVANTGNDGLDVELRGEDDEDKVSFAFEPPDLGLGPGQERTVRVRLRGRRPWLGNPKVRPIRLIVGDGPGAPQVAGAFVQRPRVSRGLIALAGLLAATTVFAAVITVALSRVVDASAANREALLQAIKAGQAASGLGSGSISGKVSLLGGVGGQQGVVGVTVQAFDTEDPSTPLASTVTAATGTYVIEGLADGSYDVQFVAAGFAALWYPSSSTIDEAEAVDVKGGAAATGIDVELGGIPAQVSGTLIAADPAAVAGASVELRVPEADASGASVVAAAGSGDPGSAAGAEVVATSTDAAGSFLLDQVPSPASYELVVSKTGFAEEHQLISLGTGEVRTGIELHLRKGDGAISGTVRGPKGVIGGARVTVTDGTNSWSTESLTSGAVGTYLLGDLPTPGTYSLVVSKTGFASGTVAVGLNRAQEASAVDVPLTPGSGSVAGTVRVRSGGGSKPAGGVLVTATNGALSLSTVSATADGTYLLDGLPIPGTYTVTFARADLQPVSQSVTLEALKPDSFDRTGQDVTLGLSTGSLDGSVEELQATVVNKRDQHASVACTYTAPDSVVSVDETEVTATSGSHVYRTLVASGSGDRFVITGMEPGTYTLTFGRNGSVPTNLIVQIAPGEAEHLTGADRPSITEQSSLSGVVCLKQDDGTKTTAVAVGVQVVLYAVDQFPITPAATTFTDGAGRYSFAPVGGNRYYIVTFSNPPNSTPQAGLKAFLVEPGTTVILPDQFATGG